jgi:hypothetical protein
MNQKIKVIKHRDRKEPEADQLEQPSRHPTREISTTIKLWISEFKQRERTTNVSRKQVVSLLWGQQSEA